MVDRVQGQLESIYDLERRHDVGDFVVQDAELARALGATGRTDEELLEYMNPWWKGSLLRPLERQR